MIYAPVILFGLAAVGGMTLAYHLFVVVALGGFTLFSFQLRKKPLPNFLIIIHALGAVTSYVLLILCVFK